MNFSFENKTVSGCRETGRLTASVQLSAETVVPDTGDDIARIASVQCRTVLKSKEMTRSGVRVTGEVCACCICITETGKLSDIRLSKDFELCFDAQELPEDTRTHIRLSVPAAHSRLINPRKISTAFEISGLLRIYGECETPVDCALPEKLKGEGLHLRYREADVTAITCAAEKSFTVSEQYRLTPEKAIPQSIIWEKCAHRINDVQMIGTKAIIRGSISVCAYCRTEEGEYPAEYEFSSPFSQIIDTGTEETEFACAHIEPTALYAEIQDTVSGEKALSIELHALAELTGFCRRKLRYVSDLYSNRAPTQCIYEKRSLSDCSPVKTLTFNCAEVLSAGEDCEEIVCVLLNSMQPEVSDGVLYDTVNADIIYKSLHGELMSVRRSFRIEGGIGEKNVSVVSALLTDCLIHTDGNRAEVHSALEVSLQSTAETVINAVSGAELDEDSPYDISAFPTVTLVRADTDDLWLYAKAYHSDEAAIAALNELEGDIKGSLLLIPKSV